MAVNHLSYGITRGRPVRALVGLVGGVRRLATNLGRGVVGTPAGKVIRTVVMVATVAMVSTGGGAPTGTVYAQEPASAPPPTAHDAPTSAVGDAVPVPTEVAAPVPESIEPAEHTDIAEHVVPLNPEASGEARFRAHGCGECHGITPPDAKRDLAWRVSRKGPELWFAGSKFQRPWLRAWLEQPTPIAGIRYDRLAPHRVEGRHPAVSSSDADAIVNFLMQKVDRQVPVGLITAPIPPSPMERVRGRILFGKQQQCFGCHRTRTRYGAEVGGVTAPTLVDAGQRLNPDWVYAFLSDPHRYVPVPRMPVYGGAEYTEYGPAEMAVLARYIGRMDGPAGSPGQTAAATRPTASGGDTDDTLEIPPEILPEIPLENRPEPLPEARVERNFQFLCAQCHGVSGDATGLNALKQFEVLPADLTDGSYLGKFTDDQIFRTLTLGGPANNLATLMPPWGNRLSAEERWELVRYIRSLCDCQGPGQPTAMGLAH